MKKTIVLLTIIFLITSTLFGSIAVADTKLISQEDITGGKFLLGYGDCLGQKFKTVPEQADITKISLYIDDEWNTGGTCKAGISEIKTIDESQWINYESRSIDGMNGWENFNVNCDVNPEDTYYLMFKLTSHDSGAAVYGSWENPYPNGEVHYYTDGSWETRNNCDLGFKIFGNRVPNEEPDPPSNPSPSDGATDVNLNPTLSVYVSDYDGDNMDVTFYDASDDNVIDIDYNVPDGGTASVTWSGLSYLTTYNWYTKANDGEDTTRGPSSGSWSFTTRSNLPPTKPTTPSGPRTGHHGKSYTYSTRSTDPEGDQIKYYFDWGDGTGDWTSYVSSGQSKSKSHTWNSPGTYEIKTKAKDEHGEESGMSNGYTVSITNLDPYTPNDPVPSNLDDWVDTDTCLEWDGGDPNGDSVTYDIYFGTNSNPPKIKSRYTSTKYCLPDELNKLTTYYWYIVAKDNYGGAEVGPTWSFTTREYNPPVLTEYPGWEEGVNQDWGKCSDKFTFRVHYFDPDGDSPVKKNVVIDDTKKYTMSKSGSGQDSDTDYFVEIEGGDIGGGEHTYYFYFHDGHDDARLPKEDEDTWEFTVNYPPDIPDISGPKKIGKTGEFTARTIDKDGEKIQYWFDWGDGTETSWTPKNPVSSGTPITLSHTYNNRIRKEYEIKVKAKDIHDDESEWSIHFVVAPKSKNIVNTQFSQIFEKLIFYFPILKRMLSLKLEV